MAYRRRSSFRRRSFKRGRRRSRVVRTYTVPRGGIRL